MIQIDYLKNHSDTISMWADCFWNEWQNIYHRSERSYAQVKESIGQRCNTDRLPLAVVALLDGKVVGTGCLKPQDLDDRPQWTPWIAGIFVLAEYRGKGVGSRIVTHLEQTAANLGFSTLYLWTPSSAALYSTLGWHVLECTVHAEEKITIMTKCVALDSRKANY